MNKEKLIQLRAAALAEAEAIRVKCVAENSRAMTDEEKTQFRAALDKADALIADIKDAERFEAAQAEERARVAAASQTRADQVNNRPDGSVSDISNPHDRAEDKPFGGLSELLRSVQRSATTRNQEYDPRLRKFDLTDVKVRAAAGLSENIGSDGGFLVTTDIAAAIDKAAFESGAVASRTTKIPISGQSNSVKIPYVDETSRANGSRFGGVRAYWVNEAEAATASKPKFGNLTLGLNKLAALVYMTDELLEDSAASETYVMQAVSEELAFALDDACIRGSGAGAPLGILNAACTVSVTKETSQAAATILYANVSKMKARMLPRSFQRAVWFTNVDTQSQLEQIFVPYKNVAGTENVGGSAVYVPPGGASAQPYGTLFGRPVIPIEQCETVGTVGDIILADMGMMLMATKGGTKVASSIHVKFLTDETAFRFTMRVDGQPALKSAITPYKGSGTLSAFVTLQTRS